MINIILIFVMLIYSKLVDIITVCIKDKSSPIVNKIDKFEIVGNKPEEKKF
jgi:hypothetical protein